MLSKKTTTPFNFRSVVLTHQHPRNVSVAFVAVNDELERQARVELGLLQSPGVLSIQRETVGGAVAGEEAEGGADRLPIHRKHALLPVVEVAIDPKAAELGNAELLFAFRRPLRHA